MTTLVVGGPGFVRLEGTSLVSVFLFRDTPQFSCFSYVLHLISDAPLLSTYFDSLHIASLFFYCLAPLFSTYFDFLHTASLFFDGLHP